MDDSTIEIRDDEINVEDIMAKIRENIRKRQAAGELPPDPDSVIASTSKNCFASESGNTIQRDLSYINSNWDINNNSYFIRLVDSHPPFIGTVIMKGRQLVHGEIRRYVDPMISHQMCFNASAVRIINQASQQFAELNQRQQDLETAFSTLEEDINAKFSSFDQEINAKFSSFDQEINAKFSSFDQDINAKAWLAHVLEERAQKELVQKSALPISTVKENTNYLLFEERFRGSREEITQRQLAFLPYFEKCSRVLDIGCGRGEFIEILKGRNIGGIGVDCDSDMVDYCRSRQLEVVQSDAISYLETLEDNSVDGILIDQVVEHLEPDYLIRLLALCYKKLNYGYYIVVETVNPLSLVSFFNFYLDMSHQKPVHPYTLKFLFESNKYREIELKYYSDIPEKAKLQKIHPSDPCTENEQRFSENYNYNINMLNLLLWGPMDYAVIGRK